MNEFVLLPPSESKRPGGHREVVPGFFDPILTSARRSVLSGLRTTLREADPSQLQRVLSARGPLLERSITTTRSVVSGRSLVLPSWLRYEGVVWSHLDPSTLRPLQRRRLLVPNALYGLSRGDDLISDYRLTFKVSLASIGPLARWWRPHISEALATMAPARLVNMLPHEHSGAVELVDQSRHHVVNVRFESFDGKAVVGHDAKGVKGVAARHVLDFGVETLPDFEWRGWHTRTMIDGFAIRAPRERRSAD